MKKPDLEYQGREKVERRLNRIKVSDRIYAQDKKDILRLLPFLKTNLSLSNERYCKACYCMERIAIAFKEKLKNPMLKAEKDDIVKLMLMIDNSELTDTEKCAGETKRDFKYFTKRFYQFINDMHEDIYPDLVSWIKPSKGVSKAPRVDRDDLITREELMKAVNNTSNFRNKTFMYVAFEGAFRIGEIRPIHISDVKFGSDGVLLKVKKDSDRSIKNPYSKREVWITGEAVELLSKYVKNHPFKDNPNAFLWLRDSPTSARDLWAYPALCMMLKREFKKAGVKKRVWTHLFRHSRLTEMYAQGLSPTIIKKWAGHSLDTRMEKVYVHLVDDDVKEALKEHYGLLDDDDAKTITCPQCGEKNKENFILCSACYFPLKGDKAFFETETFKAMQDRIGTLAKMVELLYERDLQKITDPVQKEAFQQFINYNLANPEHKKKVKQPDIRIIKKLGIEDHEKP